MLTIDHHVHVQKITVQMEHCDYPSSGTDSEMENEPDNIEDTEDIAASRKRSVVDNDSTALSGEKRAKKVTHVKKEMRHHHKYS